MKAAKFILQRIFQHIYYKIIDIDHMHIFSPKGQTKDKNIVALPAAARLLVPLGAHRGLAAQPIVTIGQKVKKFQLLAEANGFFSANIYAPISGTIQAIENGILSNGKNATFISIANDFEESTVAPYENLKLNKNSTKAELVDFIFKAGILGQGGAQFPTHIKYNIADKDIDTLIINGAECEPYLTADYRLLIEKSSALINILEYLSAILKPKRIVLAVEKQNKAALEAFYTYEKNNTIGFSTHLLPNDYPQGSELQLIAAITGKFLKKGVLPIDHNILVSNVGTLVSMSKVQATQYPIIDRVLTVSGDKIPNSGNFEVRIGTTVEHILETLSLSAYSTNKHIILGGPMMGDAIKSSHISINAGTGAVLLLDKKRPIQYNCIGCGYCVEICPMGLMPLEFAFAYERKNKSHMEAFNLEACIECGACQYICPSDVSLIESIKRGKIDFLK